MKDRLAELGKGVSQGLERAKFGVDQFLHDERGSARFSWKRALIAGMITLIAVDLIPLTTIITGNNSFDEFKEWLLVGVAGATIATSLFGFDPFGAYGNRVSG